MLTWPTAKPDFPLFIDNSALSAFKKCPTDWYYSSVRSITSTGGNIHLHAGGAFARGLEVARKAYHDHSFLPNDAIAEGITALYRFFGEFEVSPDDKKSPERLAAALVDYFFQYPFATDPVQPHKTATGHAIEFTFSLPIPITNPSTGDPLLYQGRFDLLGEFQDTLFAVDEKTASQLGQQWMNNWDLDSQFTGYCWAAREYQYPVAGAIIRGISMLAKGNGHAQAFVYRPEWQIARWYESLIETVQSMIQMWERGQSQMTLDKHACNSYGGCSFRKLCLSPQPEEWVKLDYVPRVWNPVAKEDDWDFSKKV